MLDMLNNFFDTRAVVDLGKNERAAATHGASVACHDVQIRAHRHGQICFIDDQQSGLSNTRTFFARNFIASNHIDHIDLKIRQFTAEVRRQIVSS